MCDRQMPLVMPANNSNAHKLEREFPGRMGLLMSPGGYRDPKGLPFALDNGRFVVWSKGKEWNSDAYWAFLEQAKTAGYPPRFVCVPDVVTDAAATLEEWQAWYPQLVSLGWPLAMCVQDGMTPEAVQRMKDQPDVIFVGGSTEWKWRTLWRWCRSFPRVHVGRVNTAKWLWNVHRCGAESSDGTGWFRGDKRQLAGLRHYLARSSQGLDTMQLHFEFAQTFQCGVPDLD